MWDPILPHRAFYIARKDCPKDKKIKLPGYRGFFTENIVWAKNGPVKRPEEWMERFNLIQHKGLLYYLEDE